MPSMTETTLRDLIDETLDGMYRLSRRPLNLIVGSTALMGPEDTTLTLSGPVAITDRLEGGSELMLVTDVTDDAEPVVTVSRGYQTTQLQNHQTGSVLLKNPSFPRSQIERWIRRAVAAIMTTELPATATEIYQRVTEREFMGMPEDTIDVYRVRHAGLLQGRIAEFGGWEFEDDLPSSVVSTGKALRIPSLMTDEDELIVTRRVPYVWHGQGEDATIELPLAATDLPVLWAIAYGQSRREISRIELDKIEEWNQAQAIREGVNLRLIRDLWGEVYRRVDEAKEVHRVPKRRPYRKMAKRWR